jgi:hypothetical protein
MATEDISRNATSPRKRYAGVRLQQGRVTTDDDFNEAARLDSEDRRRALLDVIGPAGTSDLGFAIGNPRINAHGDLDFDIGAGTMYLGGERLESFGEAYTEQTDWLEQAPADRSAPPDGRDDLAYLMAWEQPVCAVEDSELYETALGGPDTSTRVRMMRRVMLAPGAGSDCAAAWTTALTELTAQYGAYDPASGLCQPDTTLTVSFDMAGVTDDLCSPSVVGGYLGAENQVIRVQIVDGTHLTWGFDNGSPLYRVTVAADGKTVTVETEPKDQAHWMQSGQTVEILAWSAVLPNGEKLAELTGHLTTVAGAYDPDLHTLTLTDPLPAGFGLDWQARDDAPQLGAVYFFMRTWTRGSDTTSPAALPFVPGTAVALGHTGVLVALAGTVFVPGDYWVIAARPENPTQVVPWDLMQGRAPHGIRRFFTPLATIAWSVAGGKTDGTTISDCRTSFLPLTRRQTCCTFTVGDGVTSHGTFSVIQQAVDALPASGGCICILPGTYAQDVLVVGKQGIRFEGCGPRTRITGAPKSQQSAVFSIVDSSDITVTELAVSNMERIPIQLIDRQETAALNLPAALTTTVPLGNDPPKPLQHISLTRLAVEARDISAIVAGGGRFLRILENAITVRPLVGDLVAGQTTGRWPAVFLAADDVCFEECSVIAESVPQKTFAAVTVGKGKLTIRARLALGGIQIAGGSERVVIRRNLIRGGAGDGITLGSIAYVPLRLWTAFLSKPDFAQLAKGWTTVAAGGHLSIDKNGCIIWVPNPTPPNGPDGNPMIPVSTAELTDIIIVENKIIEMGQAGIDVAMFFDISVTGFQAIVVNGLLIEENRISGCLQVELPEIDGTLAGWAAYGAIGLGIVNDLRLIGNIVATNGRSHLQPICGLFLLGGTGIEIAGNTIRDNGPRTASGGAATPGLRGGVFLGYVAPPPETNGTEARPAARLHDNIIVCEDGQALAIVAAAGTISVLGNALTARGASAALGAAGLAQAGGGNIGLNAGYLANGGCVVIVDFGVSSELAAANSFKNMGFGMSGSAAVVTQPRGSVLFNDNQVLFEPGARRGGLAISSVLIISLDDVAIENNQIALWSPTSLYLTDLLIAAGSLRITGNRLSETLTQCLLSAMGVGVLTTASHNQATHCLYLVSALGSPGASLTGNVILIDALAQAGKQRPICSQQYGASPWA